MLSLAAFSSLFFSLLSGVALGDFGGYRDQLLLPLPPALREDGQAGFHNPATNGLEEGASLELAAPLTQRGQMAVPRYGLFARLGMLGFGTVESEGARRTRVSESRVSLAAGGSVFSVGAGYGWASRGTNSRHWKGGFVLRPSRYLSAAASYTEATGGGGSETVAELGLRPLGGHSLTLFADMSNGGGFKEGSFWGTGALLRWESLGDIFARYSWGERRSWIQAGLRVGDASGLTLFGGSSSSADGKSHDSPLVLSARLSSADSSVGGGFQPTYVHVRLSAPPGYFPRMSLSSLLGDDDSLTFRGLLVALERVRTDASLSGVFLEIRGPVEELTRVWELRSRLQALRKSGKRVVVSLESAGMGNYLLASAADRIILAPYVSLTLPGFAMSRTYLSAMLEKLGVGFQEFRFGKYKSAMEVLSRNSMSEGEREQLQRLVDVQLAEWKRLVLEDRPSIAKILEETLRDKARLEPALALKSGLVDALGMSDSFGKVARDLEKREVRLVEAARVSSRSRRDELMWGPRPAVAVAYAVGDCAMDEGMKARALAKQIREWSSDASIRALVLRVDSPGGDPLAADAILRAVGEFRSARGGEVPIIVSQGRYAASGGYWLGLDADKSFTTPFTITGSIGVIGGWFYNAGAGDKLGLKPDTVKTSRHADLGVGLAFPFLGEFLPLRRLEPDEEEIAVRSMRVVYDDFVSKTATFRKRSTAEIEALAQGRVWVGTDAVKNSLVDGVGGLEDAVDEALSRSGLVRTDAEIVEFPETSPWSLAEAWGGAAVNGQESRGVWKSLVPDSLRFRFQRNGQALAALPLEFLGGE